MKSKIFTSLAGTTLTLAFLMLALTSCNKDESGISEELNTLDFSSAVTQTEIDEVSEGVDDIIESVFFDNDNSIVSKNSSIKGADEDKLLPDCVTITKVINANSKTVTIDFGDGCTARNDNFLSGKIIMEISFNIEDLSVTINNTFVNFYLNYRKIEGEVHKTKIKLNDNGNPQAIINKNIKITWEDGSFVTVKGERKREWIEGFGNHVWGDNVFSITGTWTITNKEGVVRIATIIENLIRKTACRYIVSGIVEIKKGDKVRNINYGDGICDDLATMISNGIEREFHIGKRPGK